jgi:hypothetical protein
MTGKDISLLRKKYFAHPVLLNSKIEAEDGELFLVILKYQGIEWIFQNKRKFESFISKYNKVNKFKNPKIASGKKKKKVSKKKQVSKKKSKKKK